MRKISGSELILNEDGTVYHIHLGPQHVADYVILVGDQGRVKAISEHFDNIEYKISNREFVTHVGSYKGTRFTVMSTGIGTDNIDIAVGELDAAVNLDLVNRTEKKERKKLNLIRIGTSGSLQPDIPVDSFVISEYGLGLDGLIYYYNYNFSDRENLLMGKINDHLNWNPNLSTPYLIESSSDLVNRLGANMIKGITATASGFYGPQGRYLYLEPSNPDLLVQLRDFGHEGNRITNFEMETSALYGLGKMMGHNCCTCCAIIANRYVKQYSEDYKQVVKKLIVEVLDRLVEQDS